MRSASKPHVATSPDSDRSGSPRNWHESGLRGVMGRSNFRRSRWESFEVALGSSLQRSVSRRIQHLIHCSPFSTTKPGRYIPIKSSLRVMPRRGGRKSAVYTFLIGARWFSFDRRVGSNTLRGGYNLRHRCSQHSTAGLPSHERTDLPLPLERQAGKRRGIRGLWIDTTATGNIRLPSRCRTKHVRVLLCIEQVAGNGECCPAVTLV